MHKQHSTEDICQLGRGVIEQELDQAKFDAWKVEQEAQGNTFPTGKRGKVVDTEQLTNVKQVKLNDTNLAITPGGHFVFGLHPEQR